LSFFPIITQAINSAPTSHLLSQTSRNHAVRRSSPFPPRYRGFRRSKRQLSPPEHPISFLAFPSLILKLAARLASEPALNFGFGSAILLASGITSAIA